MIGPISGFQNRRLAEESNQDAPLDSIRHFLSLANSKFGYSPDYCGYDSSSPVRQFRIHVGGVGSHSPGPAGTHLLSRDRYCRTLAHYLDLRFIVLVASVADCRLCVHSRADRTGGKGRQSNTRGSSFGFCVLDSMGVVGYLSRRQTATFFVAGTTLGIESALSSEQLACGGGQALEFHGISSIAKVALVGSDGIHRSAGMVGTAR